MCNENLSSGNQQADGEIEKRESYLSVNGVRCPLCGSDDLGGGSFDMNIGGQISQHITCADCDASWYDIYNLADIVEVVK